MTEQAQNVCQKCSLTLTPSSICQTNLCESSQKDGTGGECAYTWHGECSVCTRTSGRSRRIQQAPPVALRVFEPNRLSIKLLHRVGGLQ